MCAFIMLHVTWLFNAVTPSLTRVRDRLEAVELMELTDSWLPLRSRDSPPALGGLLRELLRGVEANGATARETLATGANRPYKGRQSKYL